MIHKILHIKRFGNLSLNNDISDKYVLSKNFSLKVDFYMYMIEIKNQNNHIKSIKPPKRLVGDINGLSKHSRLRLIKKLASVDMSKYQTSYFVSITYHDVFPKTGNEVKKDLKKLCDVIDKNFPSISYVWRMELQKRGAPHFHFIFYFPKNVHPDTPYDLNKLINSEWSKINKCNCDYCKRYNVRFDKLDNLSRVQAYVSKYVTKDSEDQEINYKGRRWGIRNGLEFKFIESAYITPIQLIYMKFLLLAKLDPSSSSYKYIKEDLTNIDSAFILLDILQYRQVITEALLKPPNECYKILKDNGVL